MEGEDGAAGALDFGAKKGVPPDVVDVDGDADEVVAEGHDHVVGHVEGADGGAAVGVHGVQRLNGQLDAAGLGMREDGGDAIEDLLAGDRQFHFGVRAADEHHDRRAQRGGLVDDLAVVGLGLFAGCAAGGDEEAAPAEAGHLEAGGLHDARSFLGPVRLQVFPPNGDVLDILRGIGFDGLLQVERPGGHGMHAEAGGALQFVGHDGGTPGYCAASSGTSTQARCFQLLMPNSAN